MVMNVDVAYALWVLLGFAAALWPKFLFRGRRLYSQEDLVKISARFRRIDSAYIRAGFLWFVLAVLPIMLIGNSLEKNLPGSSDAGFYPGLVAALASYAIYHGWFAIANGAYPMGRMMRYVYGKPLIVRKVGLIQILIAIGLVMISIISFLPRNE